jgi:hypothetical protein
MNKQQLRSGDLLTSILLVLVGLYVCLESYRLTLENISRGDARIYSSPGFVPFVFGAALIAGSIAVARVAVREGGNLRFLLPRTLWNAAASAAGRNTLIILGLLGFYIFGLLKLMDYWLATFIFLFAFITQFSEKSMVRIAFIAAATSGIVAYLFGTVAGIPLP